MRDIKFRVWGIDVSGEGEPEMYFSGDIRDTDMSRRVMSQWEDDDLSELNPWMQYTGLKDKNGVEIYEGDIVRVAGQEGDVYYDRYAFTVRSFYQTSYDTPGDAFSEGLDECEVIGNIHENPELK